MQSNSEEDIVHQGDHFARVPDRGLLLIEGNESIKFLQGIITNNMPVIQSGGDGFYAAFLNPIGRVLFDVFVYPRNIGSTFPRPVFLVEYDQHVRSDILSHVGKYILRSRVTVKDVSDEYAVWSIWGPNIGNLWWRSQVHGPEAAKMPMGGLLLKDSGVAEIRCEDHRCPAMGLRLVLPSNMRPSLPQQYVELPPVEYTIRRILHGIPEGIDDFELGSAFPLQSNFDYMGGIDFRKGCYIGQELTFRTYHTGVTRRRILPVQLFREGDSIPTKLRVDRTLTFSSIQPHGHIYRLGDKKTRSMGSIGSITHNVALALLRLDAIHQNEYFTRTAEDGQIRFKPFVPNWWPKLVDKENGTSGDVGSTDGR